LQRAVFGIQSNSCHVRTVTQLTGLTVPLWRIADVTL
jgi:hypothetical protein